MIVENDTEKAVIPRAYTYEDLARKKYKTLPLSEPWHTHLGEIERAGVFLSMEIRGTERQPTRCN